MTLLEKVGYAKQVWAMALPNVALPADEFLIKLCGCYTEPEIEHAVVRTSKKFHGQTLEPLVLHRYCAGVLRNERKRVEQVSAQPAQIQGLNDPDQRFGHVRALIMPAQQEVIEGAGI